LIGAGEHVESLDALLQHKLRLGACVLLSDADALSFTRLRELLGATDGNLGVQMRKLEDATYVSVRKEFANRKPVTWYELTSRGRSALTSHLGVVEGLIQAANVADSGRAGSA
jgi:DNA-binding HxlR family transcriptional regulator